uniref:Uncharacterized protein n=1 Tax=viral metagenome TaxID=1070528 RepID=A0A6C0I434_9ZZZZ
MPRGRTIKAPCKGRKSRSCRTAKKTCKWASGSQRSFCRKSRNTHNMTARTEKRREGNENKMASEKGRELFTNKMKGG